MDDLRKLARQFVMHKSVLPQDFALALIERISVQADNDRAMQAIAELFLSSPVAGDGW